MGSLSLLLMGIGGIGCAFSPPTDYDSPWEFWDVFPAIFLSGVVVGCVWVSYGLLQAWGIVS